MVWRASTSKHHCLFAHLLSSTLSPSWWPSGSNVWMFMLFSVLKHQPAAMFEQHVKNWKPMEPWAVLRLFQMHTLHSSNGIQAHGFCLRMRKGSRHFSLPPWSQGCAKCPCLQRLLNSGTVCGQSLTLQQHPWRGGQCRSYSPVMPNVLLPNTLALAKLCQGMSCTDALFLQVLTFPSGLWDLDQAALLSITSSRYRFLPVNGKKKLCWMNGCISKSVKFLCGSFSFF